MQPCSLLDEGFPSLDDDAVDVLAPSPSAKPPVQLPVAIAIPTTEERSGYGGLRAYTAYCIHVSDFGQSHVVERRFDDFKRLHEDLLTIDPTLPPLPEKKMFASTDASVVAERKPAFEKLLRHCLKSEDVVFEPGQHLWRFIEIPTPGVYAARYMFKSRRVNYIPNCRKLLKPENERTHAYRLRHEAIIKANLQLLVSESALVAATKVDSSFTAGNSDVEAEAASTVASETPSDAEGNASSGEGPVPSTGDVVAAKPAGPSVAELEQGILEMLRYSVGQNGSVEDRRCFLTAGGLGVMLDLLRRIALRKIGSSQDGAIVPDQKVRNVLNALIHGEGDNFPSVFAEFLAGGGVSVLCGLRELCGQHAAFAEFVGKLLWLSWEPCTQRAFLTADASCGAEALALLSALFSSGTKSGQVMAGLLLSCLIGNSLFASDPAREAKAAAGIDGLVEELLVSLPSFKGGLAKDTDSSRPMEDVQAAETFLQSVGRNERSFARVLACATSPCDLEGANGALAPSSSASWSACAFALWCLVKVQPKPARITNLRPWIPALAKGGPARVRWLSGDFLLQFHVAMESTKDLAPAAATDSGATAAIASSAEQCPSAEAMAKEQRTVEVSMAEQISHSLGQLQGSLQQKRGEMQQQRDLAQSRQQPYELRTEGAFSSDVCVALKCLNMVREKLKEVTNSMQDKEVRSLEALEGLTKVAEFDVDSSEAQFRAALEKVHELEGCHQVKVQELAQFEEVTKQQIDCVEQCNKAVEEADRQVAATRKSITDLEDELRNKQIEAHRQRSVALADFGAETNKVNDEIQQIEKRVAVLREKAAEVQSSESDPEKVKELMNPLKQEAAKLKQRRKDLQTELERLQLGPEEAQNAATRLELEVNAMQEQLTGVRTSQLVVLERGHAETREAWQQASSRMQEVRMRRDHLEREVGELKRQMEERWRLWRPLWSAKLNRWHERAAALSQAQVLGKQFAESVDTTWQLFQEERRSRHQVLQAVATTQERLAALARDMASIGDVQ